MATTTNIQASLTSKKEETLRQVIWSTDDYFNEDAMNEWWQEILEMEDDETTIHDLAGIIGIKTDHLTTEQTQALETLLPLYKAKMNKRKPDFERWRENIDEQLGIERDYNLDKNINGTIIRISDYGLWNGRRGGIERVGSNIKNILLSDCDYVTWYGDGKDIRCEASHHDGTNFYLYRIIDDEEELYNLINNNELTMENLIKITHSLYPYVADVYGWEKVA